MYPVNILISFAVCLKFSDISVIYDRTHGVFRVPCPAFGRAAGLIRICRSLGCSADRDGSRRHLYCRAFEGTSRSVDFSERDRLFVGKVEIVITQFLRQIDCRCYKFSVICNNIVSFFVRNRIQRKFLSGCLNSVHRCHFSAAFGQCAGLAVNDICAVVYIVRFVFCGCDSS